MTEEMLNSSEELSGEEGGSGEEQQKGSRPWVPNRTRHVASKKSFDEKKLKHLVNDERPTYRGELDPRKKDPNRKPRSISRSEERARAEARAQAEEEAAAAGALGKKDAFTDFRDQYERCNASPGRLAALYATQQVRRRGAFAQEVIESTIDRSHLSAQDRAFATLLTLGVVSTQGSLDEVLNRCMQSPRDIKPDVRDAMRISTYEIIYLRKAPHAALDQGVELVKAVAPSASRLGNAILHRVLELADSFPFGDPKTDLEALCLLYAFPVWLGKLLVADLGPAKAAELMHASNEQAPIYLHVNSLKATDEEVVEVFESAGCPLEAASSGGIDVPGCYRVTKSKALADGRVRLLFSQGKVLVSDASAQAIALSVVESAQDTVLEVGAGRGTKTILLQSLANRLKGQQLDLTSMDSHGFKSDLLKKRAAEYGVEVSEVLTGNAMRLDSVVSGKEYGCVFIDAPCSGLGTLRRHHEIRWRITQEKIDELAQTGLDLLKSAAGHVKQGGCIVFSTCTVTYAENNGVVKAFLESEEGKRFKLAPIKGKACFATALNSDQPDAHFAARFVRIA